MFAFPFHTKLNPLFQKFPDFFQSCRYGLLYRLIAAPFPHRNLLIGKPVKEIHLQPSFLDFRQLVDALPERLRLHGFIDGVLHRGRLLCRTTAQQLFVQLGPVKVPLLLVKEGEIVQLKPVKHGIELHIQFQPVWYALAVPER